MPKIACPGCKKSYDVPATAAGRVATCNCGKKFRLGGKPAASQAKPTPTPKPEPMAEPAPKPSDSLWDDLDESFEVEAPEIEAPNSMARETLAAAEAALNKPEEKARWGFDWGKVAAGLGTMVLAGIGAVLVFTSVGNIRLTAILGIVAFGGLFTAINGLMGDEGIW